MTQQPAQQAFPDPLGSLVKRVRERELQLSQTDLAWLARVSRGTISNLETGRVTPDTRTWERIRTALALSPVSVEQVRHGRAAQPVLPGEALRGIVVAIMRIRDRDLGTGRKAAERWMTLVDRLAQDDGSGWPVADSELTWLAGEVAPLAPPGTMPAIQATLRGHGWLPAPATPDQPAMAPAADALHQVEELISSVSDVSEQLRGYQDRMQGFDRLPAQVQELLAHGLVASCDISSPDASPEVSVVTMVLTSETGTSLTARQEAREAALRWSTALSLATHIVEQGLDLSPREILAALKVGLDAQAPAEVRELLPYARKGDPGAMYRLARLLRKNERADEAELWLRRAAVAGHPGALYSLGTLAYEDGRESEAEQWLGQAAEAGHPDAMHTLWELLREQAPGEAEDWLVRAANAGSRRAMYQLWLLHRDDGRPDAEQWLRRAANYGHRQAIADLSELVPEQEAVRWLHRAAEAGDTTAMSQYELRLFEMRRRQQAAARGAG